MDVNQEEVEQLKEELEEQEKKKKRKELIRFWGLLALTLLATTMSGAEWITLKYVFLSEPFNMTWADFAKGFEYSIPFLLILTCHEFGHYLTARHYKINVSLPLYIPMWLPIGTTIGTFGAFIRIREKIKSRIQYFDIGIAGPLAGFVVALGVLYYGFSNLPEPNHIYDIHPEYEVFGEDYGEIVYSKDTFILKTEFAKVKPDLAEYYPDTAYRFTTATPSIRLGNNLIFDYFKKHVADPKLLPNDFEIMHYPWLFAGYLALFFTALNLLPIGQLDGGHILYGLIGRKNHTYVSSILFVGFVYYAGLGMIDFSERFEDMMITFPLYLFFLYICFYSMFEDKRNRMMLAVIVFASQFFTKFFIPDVAGYEGWLVFAFLIGRFLGVKHPSAEKDEPLDLQRQVLGWIALLIFIGSFSPRPFVFG
ncbi:MAG: site-2 protease family protein [Cyclobacteriaceae bacterium]